MASPKLDSYLIEQELKNSRKIIEKSSELSKKYNQTDLISQESTSKLKEKQRKDEDLKFSYEKSLQETNLLLKEERKKNKLLERKIMTLEQKILELNDERFGKILNRIDQIENSLKRKSSNEKNKKRGNFELKSLSNEENNLIKESERIAMIQLKLESLERTVKKQRTKHDLRKSKSCKTIVKKK